MNTEDQQMTLSQAINILEQHNKWRRGDDTVPATIPVLLGLAIEKVVGDFRE